MRRLLGWVAGLVIGLAALALVGLLAGAFSMAAGEYVSMASQRDLFKREIALEAAELKEKPEEEQRERARMRRRRRRRNEEEEEARESTSRVAKDECGGGGSGRDEGGSGGRRTKK